MLTEFGVSKKYKFSAFLDIVHILTVGLPYETKILSGVEVRIVECQGF